MKIIEVLNNNQGVVAVSIFILGIAGFLLKRLLFSTSQTSLSQKQKSGDNTVNIQSGRDTNYEHK